MIILKWTGSLPFLSYSITSSPQVAITLLGQKSAQMVVLYNTYYAVNVVGIPPCGEDNVSSSTLLYYGMCLIIYNCTVTPSIVYLESQY